MPTPEEDGLHLSIVNHLIGLMNSYLKRGLHSDIIASAAVAAAGAFTAFNLTDHYETDLQEPDVEAVADVFMSRVRAAAVEDKEK